MKVFVLLLAVFGTALAAKLDKTPSGLAALLAQKGGVPVGEIGTRIVGGDTTPIEQVPYIVSMQRFGAHRCGSVIIGATRILTAAHCMRGSEFTLSMWSTLTNTHWPAWCFMAKYPLREAYIQKWIVKGYNYIQLYCMYVWNGAVWVPIPASELSVRAGSSNSATGGQIIQVASYVNHPLYNQNTLDNDISIMHLVSALDLSPAGVAIIGMPAQDAGVAAGISARVAGWGSLFENGPGSLALQAVNVPVVTNAECNALYGGGITNGMLCAGFPEGGRDACQGDSGGPLTAGNQVIGVVSWGIGCARPGLPGVYARVAYYRNWIDSV